MSRMERTSERVEILGVTDNSKEILFDLSAGGVCCLYDKKANPGDFLMVTIADLKLRAKVAYCQERTDGFRLGLQFWSVPSDKQKALDDLNDKFSKGVPIACVVEPDAVKPKV